MPGLIESWGLEEEAPGICSQIPVVGVPGGIGSVGNAAMSGGQTGGRGPGVAVGSPGASNVGAGPGGGVAGYGAAQASQQAAQVSAATSLQQSLTPGGALVLSQLGLTPLTAVYNNLPASYFNNAAIALQPQPLPPPYVAPQPSPMVAPPAAPPAVFSAPQPTAVFVPPPPATPSVAVTPSPLEVLAQRIGGVSTSISTDLSRISGGLIGETFGGPIGAVIGQQVGAEVNRLLTPQNPFQLPSPPPSYLAYQASQPTPAPISPMVFPSQTQFNPTPLAPLVGQEYCPECDPQHRYLEAQRTQLTRDLQKERSQLRQKAIGQQQQQIQRLEEQERLPVEYQRGQDIQDSIRQKQQLLAQIDSEISDLEAQRAEARLPVSPPTPQREFSAPSTLPPLYTSGEVTTSATSGNKNLPQEQPAQRLPQYTPPPEKPTIFCVGCETQNDAFRFLNGEPSKCSVIPNTGDAYNA